MPEMPGSFRTNLEQSRSCPRVISTSEQNVNNLVNEWWSKLESVRLEHNSNYHTSEQVKTKNFKHMQGDTELDAVVREARPLQETLMAYALDSHDLFQLRHSRSQPLPSFPHRHRCRYRLGQCPQQRHTSPRYARESRPSSARCDKCGTKEYSRDHPSDPRLTFKERRMSQQDLDDAYGGFSGSDSKTQSTSPWSFRWVYGSSACCGVDEFAATSLM